MIELVPENVFPQLSGREHFETFSVQASWEYNYMFTSLSMNNYENFGGFINLMNQKLSSGEFGVYAEGMDAVLLRQGYHGSPLLFKPLNLNFNS